MIPYGAQSHESPSPLRNESSSFNLYFFSDTFFQLAIFMYNFDS